jgi:tRNA-binding EMAP/Myf-like protein
VLFPLGARAAARGGAVPAGLRVPRAEADGGEALFADADALEAAFGARALHPGDLKAALVQAIDALLAPIRARFASGDMQALARRAYPTAEEARAGDDLGRVLLRVGRICDAAPLEGSDALLAGTVACGAAGEPPRAFVVGLARHLAPQALVGRRVVVACNLKPQAHPRPAPRPAPRSHPRRAAARLSPAPRAARSGSAGRCRRP